MNNEVLADMRKLRDQLANEQSDLTAELTEFPSGSAMLDVRRAQRAFLLAYTPPTGFAVDEASPNEGFLANYRFLFTRFEPAARQLRTLVLADRREQLSPGLSLVVLKSSDLQAARRFYMALGLNFVEEKHGEGPLHFSASVGSTLVEIYPCPEDEALAPMRLGFRVPSVDQTVAELARMGARVIREAKDSPWGRRAIVEDPDRNRIEIT